MEKASKLETLIFADLLAAVMLSILAFGTVEPWSIAIFEINALLLAVLLGLRWVGGGSFGWKRLRLVFPLIALLLTGAGQLIPVFAPSPAADSPLRTLSLDPQSTIDATIKLLALVIYFIAALITLRVESCRRATLPALTIFGFAVSVFALVQRATYDGKMYWFREVSPYIAPFGPYGNYNHFAGMIELIAPLPAAYALFSSRREGQRAIRLLTVIIMTATAVLSFSRAGMLALTIQAAAFSVIGLRAARSWDESEDRWIIPGRRGVVLAALAAIVGLSLWIGYQPLVNRLGALRQGTSEYSVLTRVEYWRASWKMFLDHPVAGVGLGAFPAIYPSYGSSSAKLERLEQTHNDYLQLLTDAGMIGGLIGLWFILEIIRTAGIKWKTLAGMHDLDRSCVIGGLTGMLGISVHSFFDFNLQIAANALLFLFVCALAVAREKNETNENNETNKKYL